MIETSPVRGIHGAIVAALGATFVASLSSIVCSAPSVTPRVIAPAPRVAPVAVPPAPPAPRAPAPRAPEAPSGIAHLVILHTNDMHGQALPLGRGDKARGGFAALAATIAH